VFVYHEMATGQASSCPALKSSRAGKEVRRTAVEHYFDFFTEFLYSRSQRIVFCHRQPATGKGNVGLIDSPSGRAPPRAPQVNRCLEVRSVTGEGSSMRVGVSDDAGHEPHLACFALTIKVLVSSLDQNQTVG